MPQGTGRRSFGRRAAAGAGRAAHLSVPNQELSGHAMDNAYELDYGAILKTVRTAEVVAFRFVTVPERLLIDNRFSEADAPMVKLVPRVTTAEERFKSLKILRPRFRLPSKISAIWW